MSEACVWNEKRDEKLEQWKKNNVGTCIFGKQYGIDEN